MGGIFVTGGAGFVGSHLVALLAAEGEPYSAPTRAELDLLDREAVRAVVREHSPAAVVHLAAHASVPRSWREPERAVLENTAMTLNVLEAVRNEAPEATALVTGSGEVYGPPAELPVTEDAPLRPQNPYAVSKAACDLLAGQYADGHGLRVVRTRAFNNAGPGQSDEYVVGTLARQVAQAELAGESSVELCLGNVDSRRDFTDVRDVVRAYRAALALPPGVYNVCSGESSSVRDLLELLREATDVELTHTVDPARARAHDVPEIVGSAARLREATGWEPRVPLAGTVRDAVAEWRERLSRDPQGR